MCIATFRHFSKKILFDFFVIWSSTKTTVKHTATLHIPDRYLQGEKRETVEYKLKIFKRELKYIINKLTDWKDFVLLTRFCLSGH